MSGGPDQGQARGWPRQVIFWGAAGHAKVLNECIQHLGFELVAIFDNRPGLSSPFPGIPLYTGLEGLKDWLALKHERVGFLIAIGGDRGRDRVALHARLEESDMVALSVIHPTAFVASTARLGAGCQVLAHATLSVDTTLGRQSIVNTKASLDHECVVGIGVHVAPGATVAGCVEIGDYAMIGTGAIVLPRIKIGSDAVVGAGSVVTKDIPDRAVAYGNPATVVRFKE